MTKKGTISGKTFSPFLFLFRDPFRRSTFGCILVARWLPFGSLWLPFGPLWLPFGPFWLSFGHFWIPFGPFWFHFGPLWLHFRPFWWHFARFSWHFPVLAPILAPFSTFALQSCIFPLNRYKFSFKIEFSTPRLAEPLQNNRRNLHRGSPFLCTASSPIWPGAEPCRRQP